MNATIRKLSFVAVALLALAGPATAQEGTGELVIKTKPPGAEITLEGQKLGRSPVTKAGLMPGKYNVNAVWPDGARLSAHGRVAAGKTVTVRMRSPNEPPETTLDTPPAPTDAPPPPPTPPMPPAAPSRMDNAFPDAPPPSPSAMTPPPAPPAPPSPPTLPPSAPSESPSAAEATTTPPPPHNVEVLQPTVLSRPILSPYHPQRRHTPGFSLAPGIYCPDLHTESVPYAGWCTPKLRVGIDGIVGDFHLALLAGANIEIGGQLGFEFGSPYFQLGGPRGRLAMALRLSFDGTVAKLRVAVPGQPSGGIVAFGNTLGPNFSMALGRSALEARIAAGYTVNGFFNDDHASSAQVALLIEGWLGVRFQP